jgi:hypothetical protein
LKFYGAPFGRKVSDFKLGRDVMWSSLMSFYWVSADAEQDCVVSNCKSALEHDTDHVPPGQRVFDLTLGMCPTTRITASVKKGGIDFLIPS